jgi:hypothetical protein
MWERGGWKRQAQYEAQRIRRLLLIPKASRDMAERQVFWLDSFTLGTFPSFGGQWLSFAFGILELTATGIAQVFHLILFSFEVLISNTFRMQKYK